MKPLERDTIIQETHQALLGIKGTEDNGLVGDFKELKEAVKIQNSRISKVENKQSKIKGILIGLGVLGSGGLGMGISQLLGG